jgi:5-methylcytosine-specific restriction endonuclease McrA
MKTCGTCGEHKPIEEFANDKRRKSGKGSECKVCVRRRSREWQLANPERKLQQNRLYKQRHPEKIAAAKRARYDRLMAENPEHVRAIRRKWRNSPAGIAQNKESMKTHYYGREVSEWWKSLTDPKCSYCGDPAVEIDHVIPTSKGGTHELSNLVPACLRCNRSKGVKDVNDFLERVA